MEQDLERVTVKGLTFDPVTNVPIVILQADEGHRLLPIWIGLFEANAIALEMEKVATPRPMTHDLLRNLVTLVEAEVVRAVVDNLRDNTFFSTLYLRLSGRDLQLDARPSDAIALALRAGVPIYVTRDVMSRAQSIELQEGLGDADQWRRWLDEIKPEDFGTLRS